MERSREEGLAFGVWRLASIVLGSGFRVPRPASEVLGADQILREQALSGLEAYDTFRSVFFDLKWPNAMFKVE